MAERKISLRQAQAKVLKLSARIAKDRDALRDLIDELEPLKESCDEAIESLEYAADAMSRYA